MLEDFFGQMLTIQRWPFWAVTVVFAVIGQFTATRLFTKERAYRKPLKGFAHQFLYWGRETLPLHPIAAGFVLGWIWTDPEGAGWPNIESAFYFALAGCTSMVAFALIKGVLKKKGIAVVLPGESLVPSEPPESTNGKHTP